MARDDDDKGTALTCGYPCWGMSIEFAPAGQLQYMHVYGKLESRDMPGELVLPLIMRWIHVLSAITAVGGVIFMWLVLRPAAASVLSDDQHAALREAIRARWKFVVHTAILLFLVSGFYNYLVVTRPLHVDQPLYHALFGVKFLLALVVFVIALALASGKAWSQRMRSNPKRWLAVLATLAVAVVLVSGFLRTMPRSTVPAPPAETVRGE